MSTFHEQLRAFVEESNRIEGILETTDEHVEAHRDFLCLAHVTVGQVCRLVERLQAASRCFPAS